MREPYGEGPARHTGPESCVVGGNARGEALTGEDAGEPARFAYFPIRAFLL